MQLKESVYQFWNDAACGERLYLPNITLENYTAHANQRYSLEPYIKDFAQFNLYKNKSVLEVGVGLGADHAEFGKAGAKLTGIDLTPKAVEHTKNRFNLLNLESNVMVGDAENLSFEDASFDLVYSWGVLHHSPNTNQAIDECYRVLNQHGQAKIMIYHKYSFIGYMLWLRYALLRGKPWVSLEEIYRNYLESPGTKAYSVKQAKILFHKFRKVEIKTILTHGDLLASNAGQRHKGLLLQFAKRLWPRWIIKKIFPSHGLFMLICATK